MRLSLTRLKSAKHQNESVPLPADRCKPALHLSKAKKGRSRSLVATLLVMTPKDTACGMNPPLGTKDRAPKKQKQIPRAAALVMTPKDRRRGNGCRAEGPESGQAIRFASRFSGQAGATWAATSRLARHRNAKGTARAVPFGLASCLSWCCGAPNQSLSPGSCSNGR